MKFETLKDTHQTLRFALQTLREFFYSLLDIFE